MAIHIHVHEHIQYTRQNSSWKLMFPVTTKYVVIHIYQIEILPVGI